MTSENLQLQLLILEMIKLSQNFCDWKHLPLAKSALEPTF